MRGGAKTWQGRRPRIPLFPGDGEVAGRKQGWAGAARGLEAASKGPGQKKGRESRASRGSVAPAPRPHSPSGLSFAAAGRRLRAASSLGLRASWRPQAPLATTHGHATRALSRQRGCHQTRTARAPSGRTEGLKGRSQREGGRRAESRG